ncbi:hypothetical protein [Streptomyces sp. NPDC059918]|uniref:hypothetical protein n=1 Tax=unclassified Streptomyces TaxID=2593676 RepID=UPI003656534F
MTRIRSFAAAALTVAALVVPAASPVSAAAAVPSLTIDSATNTVRPGVGSQLDVAVTYACAPGSAEGVAVMRARQDKGADGHSTSGYNRRTTSVVCDNTPHTATMRVDGYYQDSFQNSWVSGNEVRVTVRLAKPRDPNDTVAPFGDALLTEEKTLTVG